MYRFMFDHPGVVIGAVCLVVAAWMMIVGVWAWKGAEQVREDDEL